MLYDWAGHSIKPSVKAQGASEIVLIKDFGVKTECASGCIATVGPKNHRPAQLLRQPNGVSNLLTLADSGHAVFAPGTKTIDAIVNA